MLKQIVKFKNYNDEDDSEELYFNINKSELAGMLDFLPRLEKMQRMFAGDDRTLSTAEVQEMLSIIKYLIETSYGERSEDGKRFVKSPAIFENFTQTAAYDAFLFGLFENSATLALEFMIGILPKDLVEGTDVATIMTELPAPVEPVDERPAYIREDREPTQRELSNMTQQELIQAFARKNNPGLSD